MVLTKEKKEKKAPEEDYKKCRNSFKVDMISKTVFSNINFYGNLLPVDDIERNFRRYDWGNQKGSDQMIKENNK